MKLATAADAVGRQLAGELHNRLGGDLRAIRALAALVLKAVTHAPNAEALRTNIAAYAEEIDKTALKLQETIHAQIMQLWPEALERHGLPAALRELGTYFQKQHPQTLFTQNIADDFLPLDIGQAIALYRIAVESLTNVSRHAEATEVLLRAMLEDGELVLVVADNGRGFDNDPSRPFRYGLAGMRERAGALGGGIDIDSAPGKGTIIAAHMPLAYV